MMMVNIFKKIKINHFGQFCVYNILLIQLIVKKTPNTSVCSL